MKWNITVGEFRPENFAPKFEPTISMASAVENKTRQRMDRIDKKYGEKTLKILNGFLENTRKFDGENKIKEIFYWSIMKFKVSKEDWYECSQKVPIIVLNRTEDTRKTWMVEIA